MRSNFWLTPAVYALLLGCSGVAGGDGSFWSPSDHLGGVAAAAGAAGASQGGNSFGGNASGGAAGSGNNTGSGASGGEVGGAPSGGAPGGGGTGPNTGACTFHVDFTTLTYHGKYSPKNIGAAWIQNAQGQFVKSLNVWAATRIIHLVKWNGSSGGNKVDAISSATASSHGPHAADWDCTDVNGQPVPDGPYKLMLELTEEDSAFLIYPPGPSLAIDFEKGKKGQVINPPDAANYVGITLTVN